MDRYYKVSEVAEILHMNRITIYKWIKQGKIKAIEINGQLRIDGNELRRLTKGDAR